MCCYHSYFNKMEPRTTGHAESVFRNSSISPPRNPQTSLPYNTFQRPRIYWSEEERLSHRGVNNCPCQFSVRGSSRKSTLLSQERNVDGDVDNIYDREMQSCNHLLTEVKGLRSEYHCTVDILEKLFENQKKLNEITSTLLKNCELNHPELEDMSLPSDHGLHDTPQISAVECDDTLDSISSLSMMNESIDGDESLSIASFDRNEHSSSDDNTNESCSNECEESCSGELNDAFASAGLEAIECMWDDFSIDDYVPSSTWVNQTIDTHGSTKVEPEWHPRITVPKPFSMTLREECRERKKSKSLIQAEQEKLEKEALEQAELNKPFRANPVPATTYLPLFEMINAQKEKRRQYIKENSRKMLKAKERPFSFIDRELRRLVAREEEISRKVQQEHERLSSAMFKAKPVPRKVLDTNVDEKLKEDEEYRRIRIRMRALELLASSHLPNRMRFKGNNYTVGQLRNLRRKELDKLAFLTAEHSFHPVISGDVPDHKQAYEDFQRQLIERKKEENLLTVTQPFTHRTDSRIAERKSKMRWSENISNTQPSMLRSSKATPKPCLKSSCSYSAPLTRSAQLRHEATLHKLFEEAKESRKKGAVVEDGHIDPLQREISQRSIVNDISFAMDVKRREKLKNLRQRDYENRSSYQQQLDEMKQRVKQRPFLFESVSNENGDSDQ